MLLIQAYNLVLKYQPTAPWETTRWVAASDDDQRLTMTAWGERRRLSGGTVVSVDQWCNGERLVSDSEQRRQSWVRSEAEAEAERLNGWSGESKQLKRSVWTTEAARLNGWSSMAERLIGRYDFVGFMHARKYLRYFWNFYVWRVSKYLLGVIFFPSKYVWNIEKYR